MIATTAGTQELEATIRAMITQLVHLVPSEIHSDSRLREDLGLDSVASLELLAMLDEELGLAIEMEDAAGITTFGAIVALAQSRTQA